MTTLRVATPEDAHILSTLHTACFPRGWGVHEFLGFFEREGVVAYIAEEAEQPVGFIFCWVVAGECELLSLAVLEEHRRSGIGQQLTVAALHDVQKLGGKIMHLEVNVNNKAAQALYKQFDFTITGRRKEYYRQADGSRADAVTMKLRLDA